LTEFKIKKDIPEYELENIRNAFLQKYKASIDKGDYHPIDLERITTGTDWIRAMYKHSQENNDRTVNTINEVLCWRKDFMANGIFISITF
jgi:hypothetical protein